MRLTAVICTWNRAALLRQTLEAMTGLESPDGASWELLVVNNNCTDDTSSVLEAFEGRLPLRVLRENTPGKSHALNRAVSEANGDYFLFTDDDVIVERDWLVAYTEAFRQNPEAAYFGGPIKPWFAGDPPGWLLEAFDRVEFAYAALDLGEDPVSLEGRLGPLGANMAVRGEEQRKFAYDPAFGPRPGSGIRGEETMLVRRLVEAGGRGFWVPNARVRHYVPEARQRVGHLREWYRGWGEYLVLRGSEHARGHFLGRPRWLWREVVESELRYRFRRATRPAEVWVEELKKASIAQGMFGAHSRKGVAGATLDSSGPPAPHRP